MAEYSTLQRCDQGATNRCPRLFVMAGPGLCPGIGEETAEQLPNGRGCEGGGASPIEWRTRTPTIRKAVCHRPRSFACTAGRTGFCASICRLHTESSDL